ncbi:hypothetical protein GLOTRDRAFT_70551 [Gloeophyllum trabeum ATCC 11539]|uniref:Uncharacterized protein n=1 Tax=Gloeophyllum trabeum (strain ATCC 11539 / FP-39264 / Madison 617) TaxID=670483 RepID=S7QIU0_GLOTA|nr:uncharacterized protein GLOTRDRAFT_70551 [Gloeophyllum trabeum ATCC 11539]EPQ59267.1 hypothetical protein GLOTRDRAFT_70551 [Gloeophyllum trabeum ATCC 11539]
MKLTHAPESLSKLPRVLPKELHESLDAQKAAVLVALQHLPMQQPRADEEDEDEEAPANELTLQQLDDLLRGTVERGEGNSCLLIGPRSSGKTRIVETALASQSQKPIVIRLSGHVQTTDRLAMREIARQAAQQTGSSFSADAEVDGVADEDDDVPVALPPSSHLPALISTLPTLKRPTVIILEAFDLFALHPRQALLYCLLDTAQSCRVGDDMKGVAVIGVTTRVDTINLLEKRVKSRFSGRMLRTASPRRLTDYIAVARGALTTPPPDNIKAEEWSPLWNKAVEQFLADRATREIFNETFALTRDVSVLSRILTATIVGLTPLNPFPTAVQLTSAVAEQRCPPRLSFLQSLSYPCMCLLIAATHARTSGHDAFTFEMLHETFRDQVRTSLSAPVQVEGGGIGMMKCTREAFEYMIRVRAFVMSGPSSSNVAKEFGKYRCMAEREEVKKIVDRLGQTNLKKWFSKAK